MVTEHHKTRMQPKKQFMAGLKTLLFQNQRNFKKGPQKWREAKAILTTREILGSTWIKQVQKVTGLNLCSLIPLLHNLCVWA